MSGERCRSRQPEQAAAVAGGKRRWLGRERESLAALCLPRCPLHRWLLVVPAPRRAAGLRFTPAAAFLAGQHGVGSGARRGAVRSGSDEGCSRGAGF